METEEYFPRGGVRPPVQQFRQTTNFLGAVEKSRRKKKRSKKPTADDGYLSDEFDAEYEKSAKSCATGLHISSIKEGAVVLGRVRVALDTKLYVSVPGRLDGSVMACHVSEPYNKLLQEYVEDKTDSVRPITSMFTRGQYVALKLLDGQTGNLMFSLMPQHVNSGWSHSNIKKGVLLQGAVSSVEDHGYVVDVGIPNATVFLPKNLAHEDIQLDVGRLTWCAVKKCVTQPESSVVTVTNKLQSIQDSFVKYRENDSKTVSSILPGTALEFVVDKALRNGIEGRIFNNTTSYIQRCHLDPARTKKPRLGDKVRARLLYVLPVSKVPFLTMRGVFDTAVPDLDTEQTFKEGDIIDNAKVLAINSRSIILKLGESDTGVLKVKNMMVDEDLADEDVLAKSYPPGSEIRVRVVSYNMSDYTYTVSDDAATLAEKYFSWRDISVGDIVDATVSVVNDSNIVLRVGRLTGLVPQMHISDMGVFVDPKKASNTKLPKKKFKVGQQVKARVLIADGQTNKLHLTMKPTLMQPDLEIVTSHDQFVEGKSYKGFIKYIDERILVGFFNNLTAQIPRGHVSKEPLSSLSDAFHVGQIVNCTILNVKGNKKVLGSLTVGPFTPKTPDELRKKRKQDNYEVTESKKLKQDKTRTSSESSDASAIKKKTKENNKRTQEEKKRKAKNLTSENNVEEDKRDEINLESEASDAIETDLPDEDDPYQGVSPHLTQEDMALINLDDCATHKHLGKRVASLKRSVNNRIKRINVIESKIDNLVQKGLNPKNKQFHLAMLSDKAVVEERMKCLIDGLTAAQEKLKDLGVDTEKNEDYKRKKKDADSENETINANSVKSKKDSTKSKKELKKNKTENENSKKKNVEIKVADNTTPALEVPSVGDFWSLGAETIAKNANQENEELSSSSDDEVEELPKKKRKKLTGAEKVEKVRQEEERIRTLERAMVLDATRPQSTEQFERLLLASPDNSQLWIAYMAFYLQATEIDKARAVGRKALKTISFREEQEKLNVWLAMLNFENRFGTKESLEKTLDEALQMNDSFKVHSKLLEIYQETSKEQELTSLVDLMLKKYKREPTMYTLAGNSLYKLGAIDKARSVMQKAISILEKKEHVNVIVQFALMERSMGSGERAEALLEKVVGAYPQRTDVWSVYVDMLYKANDIDNIRQVMERAVSHKMAARKMKVLFQKWIEVEEKIGDEEQVERIRQKALEFIEKAKF